MRNKSDNYYPLPPKIGFERLPRDTHRLERARSSMGLAGWPFRVVPSTAITHAVSHRDCTAERLPTLACAFIRVRVTPKNKTSEKK